MGEGRAEGDVSLAPSPSLLSMAAALPAPHRWPGRAPGKDVWASGRSYEDAWKCTGGHVPCERGQGWRVRSVSDDLDSTLSLAQGGRATLHRFKSKWATNLSGAVLSWASLSHAG